MPFTFRQQKWKLWRRARYIHSNLFAWPTVKHAGSTSAFSDWFDWWTNQMYFTLTFLPVTCHMSFTSGFCYQTRRSVLSVCKIWAILFCIHLFFGSPLCLIVEKMNERSYFDVVSFLKSNKKLRPITWRINKVVSGLRFETFKHRFVLHNVLDMRRPFRSRCFGTCHFCIKTSPHGYKLHAIVRKLQELKLRYSVISYLSYHSINISDDLPKSDISYFLFITVPSAIRRPPSAVRIRTLQSPSMNSVWSSFPTSLPLSW